MNSCLMVYYTLARHDTRDQTCWLKEACRTLYLSLEHRVYTLADTAEW